MSLNLFFFVSSDCAFWGTTMGRPQTGCRALSVSAKVQPAGIAVRSVRPPSQRFRLSRDDALVSVKNGWVGRYEVIVSRRGMDLRSGLGLPGGHLVGLGSGSR